MKAFFLLSASFHGALLLLLFSWEIPLADRLSARMVLEVSLVEGGEKKAAEGGKEAKPAEAPAPKKEKKAAKKEKEEPGPAVAVPREEKKEAPKKAARPEAKPEPKPEAKPEPKPEAKAEPKPEAKPKPEPAKPEPAPAEEKEKRPKAEEEASPPSPVLRAGRGEGPAVQPGGTPRPGGAREAGGAAAPPGPSPAGGRGDVGAALLASAGPGPEGGIPLGGGGKGPGEGRGEGGTSRSAAIAGPPGDGDSVFSEIMRRIEGAKQYPRMARRMGIEGRATVRFKLRPNGKVDSAELAESSGSEILDQASLETVQRAAPLPYKDGWLKVVIVFKIL